MMIVEEMDNLNCEVNLIFDIRYIIVFTTYSSFEIVNYDLILYG